MTAGVATREVRHLSHTSSPQQSTGGRGHKVRGNIGIADISDNHACGMTALPTPSRIGLAWVTVVWRGELGVLANWTDILDGEIVNAAWAVAQMATKPRTSRRAALDLDTAAWADTERLIRDTLSEITVNHAISDWSDEEAAKIKAALKQHVVQGALQALLAVRLTDAPETDAAKAREAVRLALINASPLSDFEMPKKVTIRPMAGSTTSTVSDDSSNHGHGPIATSLSEYFDDKICGLVATLEGQVGFAGLAQVRAEAYNSRIVALLGTLVELVKALDHTDQDRRVETEFIERYRRQVKSKHGFLIPPDFDRRRRVPVAEIYVPTGIADYSYSERSRSTPDPQPSSLNVLNLKALADRTVLLGNPGGGKTTALNVLANEFASDPSAKIPFLVTLREYAAKTPPERSVAGYIEQQLETLYQCPAPDGLIERLLVTGRAVVLFDGLDELLDTSRRREVSDRVEQLCTAYPLTPVLVTSRVVGYDQAQMDEEQFICYRLSGFGDAEVTEYAGKWFATQDGVRAREAEAKSKAFLTESATAKDLRANPLLLSLMCILYRGAGSLPGDRAGIYARCAELLLRKWDEQRDLYRKVHADHLVEPTIRYLAWWLFTREDSRAAATERELVAKTTEFLHDRGYETVEEAERAARQFVEFCQGRMWVLSDAGTTADGEKLYAFTHRTFLEYFAAWHLAATSDTPETLARTIAKQKAWLSGWEVVGELAIKIKSDSSDRGANRIYAVLLDLPALDSEDLRSLLWFLGTCLESARPSPGTVRELTRAALDFPTRRSINSSNHPLLILLVAGINYEQLVAGEMSSRIAAVITPEDRAKWLQVALEVATVAESGFWPQWSSEQANRYAREIIDLADSYVPLRMAALNAGIISLRQALGMEGGFGSLMAYERNLLSDSPITPYPASLVAQGSFSSLASVGSYLSHRMLEALARGELGEITWCKTLPYSSTPDLPRRTNQFQQTVGELEGIGVAAVLAVCHELFSEDSERPEFWRIQMPPHFRQLFQKWGERQVNFVEFL